MIHIIFGRMNMPTRGHKRLVREFSKDCDLALVYLSHTTGPKDPLEYEDKINFAAETFSEFKNVEVVTSPARQIFEVLHEVYEEYDDKDVVLFCGSDRQSFYEMVCSYNGDEEKLKDRFFEFDSIEVKVLSRDEESDESSLSASKVRQYVADNDYESYEKSVDVVDKKLMFELVKQGLEKYAKKPRSKRQTEATYNAEGQRLNNHGLHFEDCILGGHQGIDELKGHIEDMLKILGNEKGDYTHTTKLDGAPALLMFSKIEGLEGPGICLKSYMSDNPKIINTDEEIDEKYGDRPEMAEKLHYGLKLAKCIPANEAWQGDCLFSASTLFDKDGDIAFQPNKIVYAVDPSTETGKKIEKADFGIAVHTRYIGSEKKQSFKIDAKNLKNVPDNIFVMDANVTQSIDAGISEKAKDKITNNLNRLYDLTDKLEGNEAYEGICNNEVFMTTYFATYQNKVTSDKACNYIDVNNFIKELVEHCEAKINKVFGSKTFKTEKGAQNNKIKWVNTLEEVINFIKNNQETLKLMVEAINKAVDVKSIYMDATKNQGSEFKKFFRLEGGYEETGDEGIALGDKNGNYVKIVNRSEFSHVNRDPRYLSGFDHAPKKAQESTVRNFLKSIKESELPNEIIKCSIIDRREIKDLLESNAQLKLAKNASSNHPNELVRVGHIESGHTSDELETEIRDTLEGSDFIVDRKITPKDKSRLGTSGQYDTLIIMRNVEGLEPQYIGGITLQTGNVKKEYTPNKVLAARALSGESLTVSEVIASLKKSFKIRETDATDFLAAIIKDATTLNSGDIIGELPEISRIKTNCNAEVQSFIDNNEDFDLSSVNIASLKNDFGEVFGACSICQAMNDKAGIKDKYKVRFPKASNEPLVDYYITYQENETDKEVIKFSAKNGLGASPAVTSLIKNAEDLVNGRPEVVEGLEKDIVTRETTIDLIHWLYDVIDPNATTSTSTDLSYRTIAEETENWINGNSEVLGPILGDGSKYREALSQYNETEFDIISGLNVFKQFKELEQIRVSGKDKDLDLETLKEANKVKVLCSIFAKRLNETDEWKLVNKIFIASLGELIQVHFNGELFKNNKADSDYIFDFQYFTPELNDIYKLKMDCKVNEKGQFSTKKFAVTLLS